MEYILNLKKRLLSLFQLEDLTPGSDPADAVHEYAPLDTNDNTPPAVMEFPPHPEPPGAPDATAASDKNNADDNV